MYSKKSIKDIAVTGKKVFVRCDFNVPLENGAITNDNRITAAIPTIEYLLSQNAKVILCSHLGRPDGEIDLKYSMAPVAKRLEELLKRPVTLAADVVGPDAQAKAAALQPGEVLLLENVRFEPGETKNDPALAKKMADLAEIYVNDAFGTAHRAHASTAGVADYLPAVAGFLMQKEIDYMGKLLTTPEHPFVAILGGAKVSDKIGIINKLMEKVDTLIIGGGMAYTFYKAMGKNIGTSLLEEDKIPVAREVMEKAKKQGIQLLLPVDNLIGDKFDKDCQVQTASWDAIPDGWMGMDIGPKTREQFAAEIKKAKTVLWNGPMGVFEFDQFAGGTNDIAKAVADSGAISVIGGGDSVAAVTKLGYSDRMSHISTGGGASLEFLEGKELPGIACLQDQ